MENYSVNMACKKALLNKDKAKKRLSFLKESNKNIKNINLYQIVFSNKAAIKRGKGGRREYYRKRQNNKVSKELVSLINRGKFKRNSNKLFQANQVSLLYSINFFI